jgi:hypothetical protein
MYIEIFQHDSSERSSAERISASSPIGGDVLRVGSGEAAEFPTDVKEVLTLLVNSWRSISNALEVSFSRGVYSLSGHQALYARLLFRAFLN